MAENRKRNEHEKAALAALRQNLALIRDETRIYSLDKNGTKELIAESDNPQDLWQAALRNLEEKEKQAVEDHQPNAKVGKYADLKVFTDGGSRGNPGPSAAGYVIMTTDNQIVEEGGLYLGITTNNQAEYQAVKIALESLEKFDVQRVKFYLDSLLVVNQLTGVYKVKSSNLWPVHQSIKEEIKQYDAVEFEHVPREENTLADDQVNLVLDRKEKSDSSEQLADNR